MPSSRCQHIPLILNAVRSARPASILDVGIGFGKWGHLFREYTDIVASESDPKRYDRANWKVRIDGVEGYDKYITPMHQYLYNDIHIGDMRRLISDLPRYDVIFLGDVIEHVSKDDGVAFLHSCIKNANKLVLISTPSKETHQEDLCDNPLERHRSLWSKTDFEGLGATVIAAPNDIIVAGVFIDCVNPWISPERTASRDCSALSRVSEKLKSLFKER